MRELAHPNGGGTVVATTVAVFEHHRHFNNNNNNLNRFNDSTYVDDGDGTRKRSPAAKNNVCLENATPDSLNQYKRRNGRVATHQHQYCDEKFESAVKDFNLVAEDVENSLRRQQERGTVKTAEVSSGSENGRLEMDDSTDEEETCSSETTDSDEHIVNEGLLETITEEDQDRITTGSSVHSSEGCDSSPDDESTIKGNAVWSGSGSNRESTSDLSTSSSEHPRSLRDSSTRCNSDFQWIPKQPEKPPPKMEEQVVQCKPPISRSSGRERTPKREKSAPGSLDRRRPHHVNRQEREQKSRSTHVPKSPPRLEDYLPSNACQNWCCSPHPDPVCFENFHRRHERIDPQRYGSSPMLMEQQRYGSERGSHPDIYGDCNRFRHDGPMGCCTYHMAPPCCFFSDRSYHWPPPYPSKPPEHDERCRKLQTERDNLQLQVQVLTEQIEAQGDKISDLEKTLSEKKQQLVSAEDMLQREMLSRSSLETQKLELLSMMSELKLQQAALERENLELRSSHFSNNTEGVKKPALLPRMSPQPQHTSTPVHASQNQAVSSRMSPSPSQLVSGSLSSSNSPRRSETSQQEVQQPKTPPATYRRQIDIHYASLPRQQFISNGTSVQAVDSNANPSNRKGVAFGRGFTTLLGVRARGHSVPNLAESEKVLIDDSTDSAQSPTLQFNKNKGIKKIFGRMKRSGSGNLDELPGIGEFQRGGVRATAAARLGWSEPQLTPKPDKPFAEWDTENICDWLQDLGLDQYIPEAKKWVKSGQQLQETSINEIEKELGVKNPLHRKKLQLALIDTQENGSSDPYLSKAGQLDTAWVLRWLDDTGLPQHKENFLINRVDGRVLHRLTMDDLALLHVTSLLHVASLKRGIQVLRENNYEPGCLQRRSLPDDPLQPTPKQICLWTTHRVMEWLRAVDLAEYAPNLRGAGVHGGLMVLEQKFTAELLATLLSIPPGKTLLRRHLNTHFKELLGKDIIQEKREAESTLGYIPLTPAGKLKVAKKAQFSLKRKKSKGEADYGDLVCPMNPSSQSGELNGSALSNCVGMMRVDEVKEEDVSLHADDTSSGSLPQSLANSPLPQRR